LSIEEGYCGIQGVDWFDIEDADGNTTIYVVEKMVGLPQYTSCYYGTKFGFQNGLM